jgi:uncharacterized protein DUF6282
MVDLAGVIDLHLHAGPDVRERKMSAMALAQKAEASVMRGLLFKNHHTSTVLVAAAVREQLPGFEAWGGLALNEWVGGLNPAAVDSALRMGAREIWLPTLSAENERVQRGQPGKGITVLRDNGALKPEVEEIIRLVGEADVILGTGHLSPCEIAAVVGSARSAGLRKIVVTHPEIFFIDLPLSIQRELAGPGVYFERCFYREIFTRDYDQLAASIREIGVDSTVLSTDLGQPDNPDPVDGIAQMLDAYLQRGFTPTELETMSVHNPATLLLD